MGHAAAAGQQEAEAALPRRGRGATATPAGATDWQNAVDVCSAAAEAEGVVSAGTYRSKFETGGGAATKTVKITLYPNEGEAISAECKIRRGEVTEFTVNA